MNDNLVLAARKTKLLSGDKTNQVDAVIETDLPSNVLAELETQWSEGREAGKSRLECAGSSRQCQHSHWKWNCHQKMFGVANKQFRLLGVRMGTEWQGAMAICCKSQTTHTLPALYVEYIETAPWNYKPFVQPNSPRYHHLEAIRELFLGKSRILV